VLPVVQSGVLLELHLISARCFVQHKKQHLLVLLKPI
jgi:hypothetical protein